MAFPESNNQQGKQNQQGNSGAVRRVEETQTLDEKKLKREDIAQELAKSGVASQAEAQIQEQDPQIPHGEIAQELAKSGISTDGILPPKPREKSQQEVPSETALSQNQMAPKKESGFSALLRPLRTYKDDIAMALKKNKGSRVSMTVAEQKRAQKQAAENEQLQKKEEDIRKQKEQVEQERTRVKQIKEETKAPPPQVPAKPREQIREETSQSKRPAPPPQKADQLAALQKAEVELTKQRRELANKRPVQIDDGKKKWSFSTAAITISFIFIAAGLVGVGYIYITGRETVTPPVLDTGTLVFAETEQIIDVGGLSGVDLLTTLLREKNAVGVRDGSIVNFDLVRRSATNPEEVITIPSKVLFSQLESSAPNSLIRSLNQTFMLGVHTGASHEPFFVFTTTLYERAFADMLDWEETLQKDLAPLFGQQIPQELLEREPILGEENSPFPPFTDKVIQNKDTRVLFDAEGNIVLLYSFIDQATLIITTNERTFLEVFDRITSRRVAR